MTTKQHKIYLAIGLALAGCAGLIFVYVSDGTRRVVVADMRGCVFRADASSRDNEELLLRRFVAPTDGLLETVGIRDWHTKWERYSDAIIQKAESDGFEIGGLESCLSSIAPAERSGTAMIPIAVFLAKCGTDEVWVIVCRWEMADEPEPDTSMGHVWARAIRVKDLQVIASVSCG